MGSAARDYKDGIYGQLARVGKALGSGPRLEILDLLMQRPHTVEVIAGQVGQSVANTSHHLQVLRRARLVDASQSGLHVTYRIADPGVVHAFRALRSLAESRLLEIDEVTRRFMRARAEGGGDGDAAGAGDRAGPGGGGGGGGGEGGEGRTASGLAPVDRETLVARVLSGEVTVIDVRPVGEYQAGHIPGAVSVPLAELERRLGELPAGRQVVAYCRGPYCVMSLDAVDVLSAAGLSAVRLEDSVMDWRARGHALSTGAGR